MGAGREQLASAQLPVVDLGDRLGDFYNTAAIVRNLDLVITSDSAPAHLAGALGILAVCTALPFAAEWRWLVEAPTAPGIPRCDCFARPAPEIGRAYLSVSKRNYPDSSNRPARSAEHLVALARRSGRRPLGRMRGSPPYENGGRRWFRPTLDYKQPIAWTKTTSRRCSWRLDPCSALGFRARA